MSELPLTDEISYASAQNKPPVTQGNSESISKSPPRKEQLLYASPLSCAMLSREISWALPQPDGLKEIQTFKLEAGEYICRGNSNTNY